MKRKHLALIATASAFALFGGGVLTAQTFMTSRIESRVQGELPKASGVSASMPFLDIPRNLASDSIRSANIEIKNFTLKENGTKTSLNIAASNISKAKPTLVGTLELTATIPISTLAKASEFGDAQIVGDTLQVAAGAGGMGKAILIPKYSNNQLYFEIKSISVFGNEIPASSLPADIQDQIKSKSQRSLTPPKGLKVKSVSINSKGLSIKMYGSNVQLGNLGL
ncbi:MAG: hypothetical protein RL031_1036 [Actinomycetota bacterium]|jgi:hypothetical protein